MATNLIYTGLTPAQQQQIAQQHYQQIQNTNTTAGSTANLLYDTISGPLGSSTTTGFAQQYYAPPIEKLVMCEPGWRYVRWRKYDTDTEASVEVVPIMALAVAGREVDYVLGDVKARMIAGASTHFLAVLSPNVVYDAAYWDAKAKSTYYDYHANEVAQRLLKSAAGV